MVKFNASKADYALILAVAERALRYFKKINIMDANMMDITMDIHAVHCNGNPLRLRDLLAADDFSFAHDTLGIRRHLDRDTGKLADFFCPRFSAYPPEGMSAEQVTQFNSEMAKLGANGMRS